MQIIGTIFDRPGMTIGNVLCYLRRKKEDLDFGSTQQWHLDRWVEMLIWKVEFYARHSA